MITYLIGKFIEKEPTHTIVELNGIGYDVKISLSTYSFIKNLMEGKLFTHLHIKEDAHTLYGFATLYEKKRFLDLLSVNGVGPSTALLILSSLSVEDITNAIIKEDLKIIQSVKGVGTKTAQRILLELKDKIKKEEFTEKIIQGPIQHTETLKKEAIVALSVLGFQKQMAEKNVDVVLKEYNNTISLEDLIRIVLKNYK
ncbi:MAG: Holliday junction branch migration protein RuvA [Chitinophagaceae bacterium]|nr:Holliday junction branch migration protein RuvA [Chitinophagaceae bacterium]